MTTTTVETLPTADEIAAASAAASAAAAQEAARLLAVETQIAASENARLAEEETARLAAEVHNAQAAHEGSLEWLRENLASTQSQMATMQEVIVGQQTALQSLRDLLTPPVLEETVEVIPEPVPAPPAESAAALPEAAVELKKPRAVRFL